ncbi:uridine-cytidine kinase-like 1 isoform X5 [Tachysurus vachellii]|uniref:uridine-cytidine kinase-like 1 isoform X5 n=1 Tax=Tachysurus vachellii TaxID=175792 RepID=UPI00296A9ECE|nr:uridine-cytidine kinase-like 1 isoform X5 [Tachysurus vachellii]
MLPCLCTCWLQGSKLIYKHSPQSGAFFSCLLTMNTLPGFSGARISGCWALRADSSGGGEGSLDRLLPSVNTALSPRKRTTSQCKSEPPLLRTSKRTIYTAGRPPWYNEHGTQSKEAFVIGLCGGSASGKTTVARKIIEALDVPWVVLLSMDSFYKVLSDEEQLLAASNDYNFDHPDAFDFDLLVYTLQKLKRGKSVKIPVYDFTTHGRQKEWKTVYGASVIIFEGIMSFADKELLKLLDMKIFVDTDSDIRLVRRLRRDISERGREIEGVIKQYNKFVKPAFEQYIEPTMRLADIVVPRELRRNAPRTHRRGKLASQHPKLSLSGQILKKYRLIHRVHEFGLTYKTLTEKIPKQRKPRFLQTISLSVHSFLENNARMTTDKQDTITRKKVKCQRIILNDTLQNLHIAFVQQNPNIRLSYSSFCALRPFHITPPRASDRNTSVSVP